MILICVVSIRFVMSNARNDTRDKSVFVVDHSIRVFSPSPSAITESVWCLKKQIPAVKIRAAELRDVV